MHILSAEPVCAKQYKGVPLQVQHLWGKDLLSNFSAKHAIHISFMLIIEMNIERCHVWNINLSINEYWHPNLSLGRRWACLWPKDSPRPWGSDLFKISSIKKRKQINGKEDAVICAQMPDFVKIFPDYSTAKTAPGGEICKFTNATWCLNVFFEKWTWWKITSMSLLNLLTC